MLISVADLLSNLAVRFDLIFARNPVSPGFNRVVFKTTISLITALTIQL